jgi:very-short-patch-repair endonuclease
MRHEPTPTEDALWQALRGRQLEGVQFRRQHAIDRFIVDFYSREARLVIEVDGPIHQYKAEEDAIRQQFLESTGLHVLRFSNQEVQQSLPNVLARIRIALRSPSPRAEQAPDTETPPSPRTERGPGGEVPTIGPEDIFHYAYAVFHSPTYRSRYAEFLKIDFPRLPVTSDVALFAALAAQGAELVDLHLLRLPGDGGVGGNGGAAVLVAPGKQGVTFPKPGGNTVDKIAYGPPQGSQPGRVVINSEQYFEGIEPETWDLRVGGYQPLDKWLKDRKGRMLSFDEIQHYLRMVIALRETRRIMAEIDVLVPHWPLV